MAIPLNQAPLLLPHLYAEQYEILEAEVVIASLRWINSKEFWISLGICNQNQ